MKIIARISDAQWIAEVSVEELSKFSGFQSTYDDGFDRVISIGKEYTISKVFSDAKVILETHKEAAEAAKKLSAAGVKFAAYFTKQTLEKGSK